MSFSIALSGLNASGKEMGVISNNIANSNTAGFKSSRAEFGSVYNGDQAGGVEVSSVTQNFSLKGSMSSTGRSLDMALAGEGFFVTRDTNGVVNYTRAGMLTTDSNGYLVTSTNAKLQGYAVDANNNLMSGLVSDLQISTDSLPAKATTKLGFAANLDARSAEIDPVATPFDPSDPTTYTHSYTTPVYDSLGNEHNIQQYFVKTGVNTWDVHSVVNGNATVASSSSVSFNSDGSLNTGAAYSVPLTPPGADPMAVSVDFSALSQYGQDFAVNSNVADGYTSGEYTSVTVEPDGSIFATYSNGRSLLQGQVVLANFSSPQNLMQVSNTSWQQTMGSGVPNYGTAGQGGFSEISTGNIEMSNVDLTSELVGLMATQRNYSANTKSLQAVDQLTNTLMQAI